MNELILQNKKVNTQKLQAFGFTGADDGFSYCTEIINNQMRLTVTVSVEGKIYTELVDKESNEEYVLHLVENAVGSFVGQVRAEYAAILDEISAKCFDTEVFKSEQTKEIMSYARDKYGDELEYLWEKFPNNAVLRRKGTKKWYAAILTVSRRKLGIDSDELAEIIDLRIQPEKMEATVDNKKYFPGYHMNKKHWYTICLDNTVNTKEICRRIDESYVLANK